MFLASALQRCFQLIKNSSLPKRGAPGVRHGQFLFQAGHRISHICMAVLSWDVSPLFCATLNCMVRYDTWMATTISRYYGFETKHDHDRESHHRVMAAVSTFKGVFDCLVVKKPPYTNGSDSASVLDDCFLCPLHCICRGPSDRMLYSIYFCVCNARCQYLRIWVLTSEVIAGVITCVISSVPPQPHFLSYLRCTRTGDLLGWEAQRSTKTQWRDSFLFYVARWRAEILRNPARKICNPFPCRRKCFVWALWVYNSWDRVIACHFLML